MKINNLLLSIIFLCIGTTLSATTTRGKNISKMHEIKWDYIVRNANLTEEEQRQVKPLFLEHENQIWQQHKTIRQLFGKGKNNITDEKTYQDINEKLVLLQVEMGHLAKIYHKHLVQILSSKKLFEYYRSEQMFQRYLLKKRHQDGRRRKK